MLNAFLVGLGGFIGSVGRYLIFTLYRNYFPNSFPLATLLVNVIGCFSMGLLFALSKQPGLTFNPRFTLWLSTGILGGFTTFSAFGFETVELFRTQQPGYATLNIVGNLLLGLGAVYAGKILASTALFANG